MMQLELEIELVNIVFLDDPTHPIHSNPPVAHWLDQPYYGVLVARGHTNHLTYQIIILPSQFSC